MQTKRIKIAELRKPFGVQGWLWLFSYTDKRTDVFNIQPWQLKTATGWASVNVKNWREQGKGLIVQLKEVINRDVAETMQGASVWVESTQMPPLTDNEYYWSQLVGLMVYSCLDDACLGVVKSLFETGAHPIMVVSPTIESVDDEERLIPWHKQTVNEVDLLNQRIDVHWATDF